MISSIYTYTWDVKMDWGLFSKNSGEYTFLREEIVYDNTVISTYFYNKLNHIHIKYLFSRVITILQLLKI